MRTVFLSDNYYLCSGIHCSKLNTVFMSDDADLDQLDELGTFRDVIIAIAHDGLRNQVIKKVRQEKSRYIVLLNEIEADCYIKIDNIIYSSLRFTLQPLQHLINFFPHFRQHHFTRREYDVLKLVHLENHKIARRLSLSQKTTSTYRIKIQEKLNMRAKNMLAMHRVRSAIIDSSF
ncbi:MULTISPECIES: helix-turn-helix transcriptional regulator [Leclercia]|uniref:Response regulator transcription factor n=1 Tax=Leclercia barmai TaxID=2785629 RepID=A0ABS7S175_9ENTR|nr:MULTISPECIES: LuxR C-terminal-related transcriptional regulator [Leclercia]MBZ0059780.1 response regulator transcription factor [Leclercia sp. EMC7]MCM5695070.1 LuxR C-terminal-related transcriptional regulator [Leclercia sp. LTM01]MCM5699480.1 LuxR C-terminal-related transcriptional regulator [Leclercia sp. LTM14]